MDSPCRLVTVEDDARYRSSLEALFSHSPDFDLVKSYGSAGSLLADAGRTRDRGGKPEWDLVLMDLELPGIDGITATRRLKRWFPSLKVVVLTVFEAPDTVMQAICTGADGYLLKRQPSRELLDEITSITDGGAPLTSDIARTVLKLLRRHADSPGAADASSPSRLDLTDRQQEVLRALADGRSYKQVAADLGISLDTVRSHVRSLYDKLQVHSVAEAVSRALREGLV